MPRKRTISDDKLIATMLLNATRIVRGHKAKPVRLDHVDPEMLIKTVERWFDCPGYERCLGIAALANWPSWTCAGCKVYANRPREDDE